MPEGDADVVLQDLPGPVAVADEVAPRDVGVHAAGRADAVDGAREVRPRDDELPRHEARTDDLARVVGVVDEGVQRADPLGQAALDGAPVRGRDDPGTEVHGEWAVARAVLAGQLERDALAQEDRVAPAPGLDQPVRPEALQRGDELGRVRLDRAVVGEHLVEEAVARSVRRVGRRGLRGHAVPSSQCGTARASPSGPTPRAAMSKGRLSRPRARRARSPKARRARSPPAAP